MGGFGLVILAVLLVLSSIQLAGSTQSFLASKRFLNIFPALGHGVPAQIGASSNGGGLFSGVPSCEGT